jgi:hypothetical protein
MKETQQIAFQNKILTISMTLPIMIWEAERNCPELSIFLKKKSIIHARIHTKLSSYSFYGK